VGILVAGRQHIRIVSFPATEDGGTEKYGGLVVDGGPLSADYSVGDRTFGDFWANGWR
jgi:hypothetical protein